MTVFTLSLFVFLPYRFAGFRHGIIRSEELHAYLPWRKKNAAPRANLLPHYAKALRQEPYFCGSELLNTIEEY